MNLTVSQHKVCDEDCIIDLELTNTSRATLELFTHSLPWRGYYSVVLVATGNFPAENPLSHPLITDDPPAALTAFTTIKLGESLKGEIRLASRIPDLVKLLKNRDMILFWAYQPTTVNHTRGKWVGGWLLLPKLP